MTWLLVVQDLSIPSTKCKRCSSTVCSIRIARYAPSVSLYCSFCTIRMASVWSRALSCNCTPKFSQFSSQRYLKLRKWFSSFRKVNESTIRMCMGAAVLTVGPWLSKVEWINRQPKVVQEFRQHLQDSLNRATSRESYLWKTKASPQLRSHKWSQASKRKTSTLITILAK